MSEPIVDSIREQYHIAAKRIGWSIERFDDGTYQTVTSDDGWQLWQEAQSVMFTAEQIKAGLVAVQELFEGWKVDEIDGDQLLSAIRAAKLAQEGQVGE